MEETRQDNEQAASCNDESQRGPDRFPSVQLVASGPPLSPLLAFGPTSGRGLICTFKLNWNFSNSSFGSSWSPWTLETDGSE